MRAYLVFDVGCIECGEGSSVVGIYKTEEEAQKAKDAYFNPDEGFGRPEWGGQHYVEIFEIDLNPNLLKESQ